MRKSYVIFGLIIVVLGLMPVVSAMSEVSSSSGELGVGVTLMTDEYLVKVECVVDEELLKEYDLLVAEMNDLDPTSSVEEVKAMIDKVSAIEDKIAKIKMLCEPVEKVVLPSVAVSQEMDVVAPSSTGGGSGGSSSSSPSAIPSSEAPTTVSSGGSVVIGEPILLKEFMIQSSVSGLVFRCADLKSYDEKYAYYEKLYSLSDKELKDMGYLDRKDIEKILDEISDGIKMLESVCGNSEVVPSVEISNVAISVAKPIVASSGVEIKDYYRAKIESISSSDDVDEQIEDLKSLRTEIDGLIEELIKSKDVISTDDMDSIVSEINVRPGVIEADNIRIESVGKKILMNIDDKPISIEPAETEVVLSDGDYVVKVSSVSIQDNVLKVGNSEVKVAISDIVQKLDLDAVPNSVVLSENDNGAVYSIDVDNKVKLLGLIPVVLNTDFVVDAKNGDVLEENKPWYSFLVK